MVQLSYCMCIVIYSKKTIMISLSSGTKHAFEKVNKVFAITVWFMIDLKIDVGYKINKWISPLDMLTSFTWLAKMIAFIVGLFWIIVFYHFLWYLEDDEIHAYLVPEVYLIIYVLLEGFPIDFYSSVQMLGRYKIIIWMGNVLISLFC